MNEKPFKDEDVLWQWEPTDEDRKEGRRMLAMIYTIIQKSGHSSLERNGFDIYHKWYLETDWVISQGNEGVIIAELLRQRQELEEKLERIHACHDAEFGVCHQYCDEVIRLRQAFHAAINRPKGVVPAGYEDLYDPAICDREKGGTL
jgi:hypothetical protein